MSDKRDKLVIIGTKDEFYGKHILTVYIGIISSHPPKENQSKANLIQTTHSYDTHHPRHVPLLHVVENYRLSSPSDAGNEAHSSRS